MCIRDSNRTAQHVPQEPQAAFTAALLQDFRSFPHGLPIHADQALKEKSEFAHQWFLLEVDYGDLRFRR